MSVTTIRHALTPQSTVCRIHHHNVLRFLGFYEDPENFYFVLPLAPHGDLYQWLDGNRRLRELVAPKVVACVSEALDHLHSHRIAHRDIKPENVLVFGPDHFCLSDFGWACMGSMDRATLCGTPEFLAPEVLDAPRYYYDAVSADMWSLGVLTYELFYHRSPFYCEATRDEDDSCYDGNDSHGRVDAIYAKIRNFHEPLITPRVPTVDESFGPLVRDFCSQLLRVSPADRMPASLAARHPLLRFGPTHHGSSTDADAAATTPPPSLSWHATSTAAVSASPTCHERGDRLTRYFTPGEKRW
jgi:serine/threonine protein kinase